MVSPMTIANFSELREEGLQEIYFDTIQKYPVLFKQFYNVLKTKKYKETDFGMVGFGYTPVKKENSEISYTDVVKGRSKVYTQVARVGGYKITYEMKEHEMYNTINSLPREFAQSEMQTIDYVATNVLNRAINGSYLLPDGKTYAATDHPQARAGGTNANRPTSMMTGSRANIETALGDISLWTNESGLPMMANAEILMCHPTKVFAWREFLDSPQRPDTSDRAINTMPKMKVVGNPYFGTSATDQLKWCVICNTQNTRKLKMFVDRMPGQLRKMATEKDYDSYYSDIFELAVGVSHWMDIYFGYWA